MTLNEKAIEVCRMVIRMAEETGNCGVCCEGEDDEGIPHADGCPYPLAKQVINELAE